MSLSLLGACQDYALSRGKPSLTLSADQIDFEEVVLGYQSTIGVTIGNEGRGDLELSRVALDEASSFDFTVPGLDTFVLAPGASTELKVRYQPDVVGQDRGQVEIVSNDPDRPMVELNLDAFGTEPLVDIDPVTLWFGQVDLGDSRSRDLEIAARGSGTLVLQELNLLDDAGDAFSLSLPAGVVLPYRLVTGLAISAEVTFTPPDTGEWVRELQVLTNDPTTPEVLVSLLGNTLDDPTENADPVVEITDPNAGAYSLGGDAVTISAICYDEEDEPDHLAAIFYANGLILGTVVPDATGLVELETKALPVGDVSVKVMVVDSEGGTGSDTVDLKVWDPEEPVLYIISGGGTIYDYWSVDDDVSISVDGTLIYVDSSYTADSHPPFEFEAKIGAEIAIRATDVNYCAQMIDGLFLHFGTGPMQGLNNASCRSACPEDPCFDPDFAGPWPNTFLDATYTIAIP